MIGKRKPEQNTTKLQRLSLRYWHDAGRYKATCLLFPLPFRIFFMSDNASPSMDKAITAGLSEVTLARTLELYDAHRASGSERILIFRGV